MFFSDSKMISLHPQPGCVGPFFESSAAFRFRQGSSFVLGEVKNEKSFGKKNIPGQKKKQM